VPVDQPLHYIFAPVDADLSPHSVLASASFLFWAKQFHCQWTAVLSTPVPTKGAGKGMQTTLTGSSIRTAVETMVDTVQTRSGKFGKTPIRMTSEVRRFRVE